MFGFHLLYFFIKSLRENIQSDFNHQIFIKNPCCLQADIFRDFFFFNLKSKIQKKVKKTKGEERVNSGKF